MTIDPSRIPQGWNGTSLSRYAEYLQEGTEQMNTPNMTKVMFWLTQDVQSGCISQEEFDWFFEQLK